MVSKRKILVVEDNALNRELLCEILEPQYDTIEAENGQVALDLLKKCRNEISLILLDIVMPVMDGYQFLSIVKTDTNFSSIPVIVTTQSDSESDEVTALSHGAADFVAKPYKPQVILHRVASIIHLRETAAMINEFQYDRLTGLISKGYFYQQVNEILRQNPEKEYDIVCSDIVNFKLINDVFGMPTGDRLLCGIADMYANITRGKGLCSHFHADQFACLLEHKWEYTDAMFLEASAWVNSLSNVKNIVMKWGIYPIRGQELSVEQMCDRALLAARNIRGQYGKHFAVYDDELRSKMLREQAITDSMERALAENQFEIYLQPKYRISDNHLAGSEALVRWNHPEWGIQSPGEFIPLFEQNGFITKLDQFVWERACAVLQEWDSKGYPPSSISVNVSRADIYNADLSNILIKIIEKYNLAPSRLHLEITESAYTDNPKQIIDTVGHLRELGFIIEMDDFGSGYSSLNMLNEMPVDILKLDMKFIQSETTKPVNQGILRFIMSLARWMDLSVVAEGVETREQLERLREIGCDCAQGYYFAKPMPVKEFESLLESYYIWLETQPQENLLEQPPEKVLLIADEDPCYRHEVRQVFSKDFLVIEAADSQAAFSCIAIYEDKLAAVILGLKLSNPDGLSVLELLHREKAVQNIPVIVTAPHDEALEAKALELGADDFACKPHLPQSLKRRVQRAIRMNSVQDSEHSDQSSQQSKEKVHTNARP